MLAFDSQLFSSRIESSCLEAVLCLRNVADLLLLLFFALPWVLVCFNTFGTLELAVLLTYLTFIFGVVFVIVVVVCAMLCGSCMDVSAGLFLFLLLYSLYEILDARLLEINLNVQF